MRMLRHQSVLPYEVETTDECDSMTARGGLPLVVETARALRMHRSIEEHVHISQRESGYGDVEKIESLILLLASGGTCLDDIEVLRADRGLCRLLNRKLPSADTLLATLYAFHDESLIKAAQERRAPGELAYIPEENGPLRGLARVNVEFVRQVAARGSLTKATLDHDATIQESHKREAQWHYKKGRGYQPAVIYWAEQDLVVGDEYRDGNVPAGMGNLALIRRGFAALPPGAIRQHFFRADSACYEEAVLKWLSDPKREGGPQGVIGFTISADMSGSLRKICGAVPEEEWACVDDRTHETVTCADVVFAPGEWSKGASPLRYIAVRIHKKQLDLFTGEGETRYLAIVSNRWDVGAAELLRWHWQKAGTIEHVHDVCKNELASAVPPCGRFGANAAWFRLSLITYNVLSALKSLALPARFNTARPKRLRYSVFTLAGRILTHAGKVILRIGVEAETIAGLIAARARLFELATSSVPT